MRSFAISDIHGCAHTFQALLDTIALSKGDTLYLLGDYVDRGPDSRGVVDMIMWMQANEYQVHCLRGNHEELVTQAFSTGEVKESWMRVEGEDTFRSFGVENPQELAPAYRQFFQALHNMIEAEGFILVHAGLNFERLDPFEDQQAMRWLRHWHKQIRYDWLAGRIILHGHTPVSRGEISRNLALIETQQWLDIDAGCVFAHKFPALNANTLGHLCAFDMHNRRLFFEKNREG